MIPQAAIERYLKIQAYAEKGEEGERKNARKLMQKMEVEWPGIGRESQSTPCEQPFQVPSSREGVGFWEAARDAMDLMAGRQGAHSIFFKYAQELEEQRKYETQRAIPQMVKLNRTQAKALVDGVVSPFITDTMFGTIKISANLNPNESQYWEFYAQDPDNRILMCEEFGALMCRAMAQFMAVP